MRNMDEHNTETVTCGVQRYFDVSSARYYYYLEDGTTTWDAPARINVPLVRSLPDEHEVEQTTQNCVAKNAARQERLQLITRRQELNSQAKALAKCQDELENSKQTTKLWENACKVAERNKGVLSVAWVEIDNVHPLVFHQRGLVALKLIGTGLKTLPEEIGTKLKSLTCLSVANNCLTTLPDRLTLLHELDITRNKLESLPENFGSLMRLERLHLSGNYLRSLPNSFGNLVKLKRVVLDGNNIRILPETLGHMSCTFFSINFNKLISLPHCIKNMPNLEHLSACNNLLRSLPGDIGSAQCLRYLHLSNNKLSSLPEGICKLSRLASLCLEKDFMETFRQQMNRLPLDFHQLMGLCELKLNNNSHMVYPPVTVLQKGLDSIRLWCKCRAADRLNTRRHIIVLALHNVLSQIQEFGVGHPAHFNSSLTVTKLKSGVKITRNKNMTNKKCEVVGPYIGIVWDEFWESMLPRMEEIWADSFPAGRSGHITAFSYSHEEVDLVLEGYQDAAGGIFIQYDNVPFKRCDCRRQDNHTRRRVCIPPDLEWMCNRRAHLMRMDIVLERQAKEQKRMEFEQEDIEFRMEQSRKYVRKEAAKPDMKKHYKQLAIKLAEEIMKQKATGEVQDEMEALKQRRRNELETKLDKEKNELNISRTRKLKEMQARVTELEEEANSLQGWKADQKKGKVEGIKNAMKTIRENELLEDIERRRQEGIAELNQEMEKKAAKKSSRLGTQLTKKRSNKKEFQDLVEELSIDLVNKEVEKEAEKAKRTALDEHAILHRVTAMWLGLGMKETFAEWKTWVQRRVSQRRKDRKQTVRQAWHEYKVLNAGLVVAEQEVKKWEEMWDDYNDTPYWIHRETGEVRYDCKPVKDEYLPEGYMIPDAPKIRLEELSESEDEQGDPSLTNKEDMEKSGEHADLNKTEDDKQQQHGQLSDNMIESSSTATDNTSSSHHTTEPAPALPLYSNSVTAKVEAEVARAVVRVRDLRKRRVAEYEMRREKRIELQVKENQVSSTEYDDSDHQTWATHCEEGSAISLGSGWDMHSGRDTDEMSVRSESDDAQQDVSGHQPRESIIESCSPQSRHKMSHQHNDEPIEADELVNEINNLSSRRNSSSGRGTNLPTIV